MKKQLFKSGTKGILIGLVVSMIMSLIWHQATCLLILIQLLDNG